MWSPLRCLLIWDDWSNKMALSYNGYGYMRDINMIVMLYLPSKMTSSTCHQGHNFDPLILPFLGLWLRIQASWPMRTSCPPSTSAASMYGPCSLRRMHLILYPTVRHTWKLNSLNWISMSSAFKRREADRMTYSNQEHTTNSELPQTRDMEVLKSGFAKMSNLDGIRFPDSTPTLPALRSFMLAKTYFWCRSLATLRRPSSLAQGTPLTKDMPPTSRWTGGPAWTHC